MRSVSTSPWLREVLRGLAAAWLCVALTASHALASSHRHALGAESRDCAACVVAHAPAAAQPEPAVLPLPDSTAAVTEPRAPVARAVPSFSHAAPLACGPPA